MTLTQYVIYHSPSDYPDLYVVRAWTIDGAEPSPGPDPVIITATLAAAREAIPPGLYNLGRYPADDPVILEVWV